jgi:hypothetical protein
MTGENDKNFSDTFKKLAKESYHSHTRRELPVPELADELEYSEDAIRAYFYRDVIPPPDTLRRILRLFRDGKAILGSQLKPVLRDFYRAWDWVRLLEDEDHLRVVPKVFDPPTFLQQVSNPPGGTIQRAEEDVVWNALVAFDDPVVVRGMPGIGKKVLVQRIAHRSGVDMFFPDGVLWLSGPFEHRPDDWGACWANILNLDTDNKDQEEVEAAVKQQLGDGRYLVIMTDIGSDAIVDMFLKHDYPSQVVITTPSVEVAQHVGRRVIRLGPMCEENAIELAEQTVSSELHVDTLLQLVKVAAHHPQAINAVSALVNFYEPEVVLEIIAKEMIRLKEPGTVSAKHMPPGIESDEIARWLRVLATFRVVRRFLREEEMEDVNQSPGYSAASHIAKQRNLRTLWEGCRRTMETVEGTQETYMPKLLTIDDHVSVYDIIQEYYPALKHHVYDLNKHIPSNADPFFGRDFVFETLESFIANTSCGYLRIVADAGLGKTAVAAEIVTRYQAIGHFFDARGGITQTDGCLNHLSARLIARYDLDYTNLPDRAGRDANVLMSLLDEAVAKAREQSIILIIDALDEADPVPAGRNWGHLPSDLPEGVYVILTHRPGDYPIYAAPNTPMEELVLSWDDPRQQADIEAYLRYAVKQDEIQQAFENTPAAVLAESFVSILKEKSQGNFMYLRYVLGDIAKLGVVDFEALPQGIFGYYEQMWAQMKALRGEEGWNTWNELYRPAIGLLGVAGEPVTTTWLADHLDRSEIEIRERALQPWRRFLGQEEVDDRSRWHVVHQSFSDFLDEKVNLSNAHRRVAGYYTSDSSRWGEHNGYAFRHLSAHLAQAGMLEELGELIEGKEWLAFSKDYNSTLRTYIQDVENALEVMESHAVDGLPQLVAWSLWFVTLTNPVEVIPYDALEALVRLGQRGKALSYISAVTNSLQRVKGYCWIGVVMQELEGRQKAQGMLQRAQREVRGCVTKEERARGWLVLAGANEHMGVREKARGLRKRAQEIADAIQNPYVRIRVLSDLVKSSNSLENVLHSGIIPSAWGERQPSHRTIRSNLLKFSCGIDETEPQRTSNARGMQVSRAGISCQYLEVMSESVSEQLSPLEQIEAWSTIAKGWAGLREGKKVKAIFQRILRAIKEGEADWRAKAFEKLVFSWDWEMPYISDAMLHLDNLAHDFLIEDQEIWVAGLMVYVLSRKGYTRFALSWSETMKPISFDDGVWLAGALALAEVSGYEDRSRYEAMLNEHSLMGMHLLPYIARLAEMTFYVESGDVKVDDYAVEEAMREDPDVYEELDIAWERLHPVWCVTWGRLARVLVMKGAEDKAEKAVEEALSRERSRRVSLSQSLHTVAEMWKSSDEIVQLVTINDAVLRMFQDDYEFKRCLLRIQDAFEECPPTCTPQSLQQIHSCLESARGIDRIAMRQCIDQLKSILKAWDLLEITDQHIEAVENLW